MLHLNPEYRNIRGSFSSYLLNLRSLQRYEATSVKDFLDNKHKVQPTRSILPFALFFNGKALIGLHNVNYERGEDGLHKIYDITGAIDVKIGWTLREKDSISVPEGHLYKVYLLYRPSIDEVVLFSAKVEGPRLPETEKEAETGSLESRVVPRAEPA